jgi:hypothetical protein
MLGLPWQPLCGSLSRTDGDGRRHTHNGVFPATNAATGAPTPKFLIFQLTRTSQLQQAHKGGFYTQAGHTHARCPPSLCMIRSRRTRIHTPTIRSAGPRARRAQTQRGSCLNGSPLLLATPPRYSKLQTDLVLDLNARTQAPSLLQATSTHGKTWLAKTIC